MANRKRKAPTAKLELTAPTGFSRILVRSEPNVQDPRELQTILLFSLRNLWGEVEAHSCQLTVSVATSSIIHRHADANSNSVQKDNHCCFVITCLSDSVASIRAALTMVTPPPYLETSAATGEPAVYLFDVLAIEDVEKEVAETVE